VVLRLTAALDAREALLRNWLTRTHRRISGVWWGVDYGQLYRLAVSLDPDWAAAASDLHELSLRLNDELSLDLPRLPDGPAAEPPRTVSLTSCVVHLTGLTLTHPVTIDRSEVTMISDHRDQRVHVQNTGGSIGSVQGAHSTATASSAAAPPDLTGLLTELTRLADAVRATPAAAPSTAGEAATLADDVTELATSPDQPDRAGWLRRVAARATQALRFAQAVGAAGHEVEQLAHQVGDLTRTLS
jgi:hypothetical protein